MSGGVFLVWSRRYRHGPVGFAMRHRRLLGPLRRIDNPLNNHPALPVLNGLLLRITSNALSLANASLRVRVITHITLIRPRRPKTAAIPTHGFFSVYHNLPRNTRVTIRLRNRQVLIHSKHDHFSLSALPTTSFPGLSS